MNSSPQQPADVGRSPGVDEIDRWWLLTWTTYGTWLPGDRRGFVSPVATSRGESIRHNVPGTPYDADHEGLRSHHQSQLVGTPIYLSKPHAHVLLAQFRETARHRDYSLAAAAIMREHVYLVVGVIGDPEPADLLRDFKAYGSRMLNREWSRPESGTWWTESGSKRKLKDEDAVLATIVYVRDQYALLALFVDALFASEIGSPRASGGR